MKKKTIELGGAPVLDGETDAFIADGYSGADLDRAGLEPPAPSCG